MVQKVAHLLKIVLFSLIKCQKTFLSVVVIFCEGIHNDPL